jgi:hypothetical protein
MNQLVPNPFYFSANLLPGCHAQLDCLAGIFLQNAKNCIAGLQFDLRLGEQVGANKSEDKSNQE